MASAGAAGRDTDRAGKAQAGSAAEFAERLASLRDARAARRRADAMPRRSRAIDAWLAAGAPAEQPPL